MQCAEYRDPGAFLGTAQSVLEEQEAENGLMLGIALRLVDDPVHYGAQPFLAVVGSGGRIDLVAMMTPPHLLLVTVVCEEPGPAIEVLASHLKATGWSVPGILAREDVALGFEQVWTRLVPAGSGHGMRQRVYEVRSVVTLPVPPGLMRQATPRDVERAASWRVSFLDACFGKSDAEECQRASQAVIGEGNLYFWEDGKPVSMAGYSRPTPGGVAISLVYTPPESRRCGYASALVASLCRQALAGGKSFCTLHTDLSNPTSNHIYQRMGFRPVADVLEVVFSLPVTESPGSDIRATTGESA